MTRMEASWLLAERLLSFAGILLPGVRQAKEAVVPIPPVPFPCEGGKEVFGAR